MCKFKIKEEQGISKKAVQACGGVIANILSQMLDEEGKFKDANLQAKFEAWQQSEEGAHYA